MIQHQDVFDVVYTHTDGDPLCIVHSGIPYPAGSSILEKRKFLEDNYDWLRCALMREPRGHKDMFGVFLTPPSSREFDAGLIYIDGTQYSHMCGHGTIAIAMAMVALGMVQRGPGETTSIRFETTAGLVVAEVAHSDTGALWTRFENVPAFVAAQDIPLELPGIGPLKADIVWGGNFFGLIDITGTSLRIGPEKGGQLAHLGVMAREQLRAKITPKHPTQPHIDNFNFVTFWHEPDNAQAKYKNVHIWSAGQISRSAGGTGTSAMMAMYEARGELKLHEPMLSEGLLGQGVFEGRLIGEVDLNGVRAVRPTVKGTASILGTARWVIDRNDPVGAGFLVA